MKKIIQPYPVVAIIGRTNVGKSTIFNRLTEKYQALVSNIPGTTRDQRFGECHWQGKTVLLSDTAGLDVESEAAIDKESIKKAKQAIKDADLILFVVDVKDGLLPQDKEFGQLIKKSKTPTILVINKADSKRQLDQTAEFHKLGFKDVQAISAKSGAGTGDLMDLILATLNSRIPHELSEHSKNSGHSDTNLDVSGREIKISIIGKPNVGKSSLINKIIGEERAIVSPVPHTTRDSQDITIEFEHKTGQYNLTFIDTAGIIKKRKIKDRLQQQSMEQSLANIAQSDLVLLLIDAGEPVTAQDKNISKEILENSKSLIFVVNKWDLVADKTTHSDKEFITFLYKHFPYLTWAPVVFTSALTGFKVERLINVILEIYNSQHKEIPESELKEFVQYIVKRQSPRKIKGIKPPFIHAIKQIKTNPLTFEITADQAENIHFSYRRFITNELRKKFDLWGCGIKLRLSEKK